MPGHEYTKDATVHFMEGSEASYLFVTVDNQIADIESDAEDYKNINDQILANGWTKLVLMGATFYYQKVDANTTAAAIDYKVFNYFKIDADESDLSGYEGKTLEVKAYAIQADGFDSAIDAWNAINNA